MKHLYLLLSIAFIGTQANAQTFSYQTSDSVHTDLDWDTFGAADMYFSANPVGAIQFGWELVSNDMPTDWSYSLCDYTSCYPGIPSNGTMTAISASEASNGTMGFFKISLHPGTTPAFATVKIYIHDINDSNIGDTITFTFNMDDELSTYENELTSLSVYPNPAQDQLVVDNINLESSILNFYSLSGQLALSHQLNGAGKEIIDITSLEAGMYVLSYLNSKGVLETKKLTVK